MVEDYIDETKQMTQWINDELSATTRPSDSSDVKPRVMMFGSYSKGYSNPDSDIDLAIIVSTYGDRKPEISKMLWHDVDEVSFLIKPILIAEDRWSPLYDDVMRTGMTV